MADFNVRSDAVDVEQIMQQIRGRIREKRGVDYSEEQIQELARVKLEKFLDPKGVRSDLLDQFRRVPVTPSPQTYEFDDRTLFESDKAIVRFFRRLLRPLLKLLFNPNTLNHVLHTQTGINRHMVEFIEHRASRDALYYEVMHNLVVEVTRASIEVKNMKMRVESIASRLEFNERRARALESVVQYRPEADRERERDRDRPRRDERRAEPAPTERPEAAPGPVDPITGGDSLRSRRKRRRRGRRSGPGFEDTSANAREGTPVNPSEGTSGEEPQERAHVSSPEGTPVNSSQGTPVEEPAERTHVSSVEEPPERTPVPPREEPPVEEPPVKEPPAREPAVEEPPSKEPPVEEPSERTPVNPREGTPAEEPTERTHVSSAEERTERTSESPSGS